LGQDNQRADQVNLVGVEQDTHPHETCIHMVTAGLAQAA